MPGNVVVLVQPFACLPLWMNTARSDQAFALSRTCPNRRPTTGRADDAGHPKRPHLRTEQPKPPTAGTRPFRATRAASAAAWEHRCPRSRLHAPAQERLGRAPGGRLLGVPGVEVGLLAVFDGSASVGEPGEEGVGLGDLLFRLAGPGTSQSPFSALLRRRRIWCQVAKYERASARTRRAMLCSAALSSARRDGRRDCEPSTCHTFPRHQEDERRLSGNDTPFPRVGPYFVSLGQSDRQVGIHT